VATTHVWLDHQLVDDRVVAGREASVVVQGAAAAAQFL